MSTPAKCIYLNQDDAAFYRCKPVSEMTVEGLERTVDFYAQGDQLAGLAFCVNMQRALFASKTWETMIDGYDPALGDDQPVIKRGGESRGLAELRRKGIDQFEVWVRRARYHGIEAYLSMRMNDCHGLEGHGDWWKNRTKGSDQDHFQFHASEFWKKHPELRRAPYRYERSFESGFDFAHREIREHTLKFIAEVFDRYDMDGFELDWMRWLNMFAPGGEAAGLAILNDFVAQVNALRRQAEKRRGHAIGLRHRVPAEPLACEAMGYDVPAWVEMGAAEQVILSAMGGCANFDYPIPLWRRLVGKNVKLLALAETIGAPYPGVYANDYHFLWGSASAALEHGADGVYLFNECYRETGTELERKLLSEMLGSIGSPDTLQRRARRYAVTFPQIPGPGRALGNALPVPLTNPKIGANFARLAETIMLRIPVGRKSEATDYVLRLGFSSETPVGKLDAMPVWLNTHPVTRGEVPPYRDLMSEPFPKHAGGQVPDVATHLLHYALPADSLHHDVNIVEFEPPAVEGSLVWAEVIAAPRVPAN
jgi:hypothetical protein